MIGKPSASTDADSDGLEWFPTFPPRGDVQTFIHLTWPSIPPAIVRHLGYSETTLVVGNAPVAWNVVQTKEDVRIPELMVAFDVDCAAIFKRNGYAINLVGKPPDFALDVASPATGPPDPNPYAFWRVDPTGKLEDYERFGVTEYWRFDPSGGEWLDSALAGDRLVDGRYRPIEIEWSSKDVGRGYSAMLGLYVCWEEGRLRFYAPERGRYLPTFDDQSDIIVHERQRADSAELRERQQSQRADQNALLPAQERRRAAQQRRRADLAEEEVRRLRQRLREQGETDLL